MKICVNPTSPPAFITISQIIAGNSHRCDVISYYSFDL